MPSFATSAAGYRSLWTNAAVMKKSIVERTVLKILKSKDRYKAVEAKTGVPWFWIACVHLRESGGDFAGVLHNGEKIIGKGKKTTKVPRGRGPFRTWEEAAIDALTTPPHQLQLIKVWSVERCLYEFERYNGWGYFGKINSPYVWASTSHQQRGKYVADGKYDSNSWDQQLGCAALMKMIARLDPVVEMFLDNRPAVEAGTIEVEEDASAYNSPTPTPPSTKKGNLMYYIIAALLIGVGLGWYIGLTDFGVTIGESVVYVLGAVGAGIVFLKRLWS